MAGSVDTYVLIGGCGLLAGSLGRRVAFPVLGVLGARTYVLGVRVCGAPDVPDVPGARTFVLAASLRCLTRLTCLAWLAGLAGLTCLAGWEEWWWDGGEIVVEG